MCIKQFTRFIFLVAFLCCSVVLADEAEDDTTIASGGNQIVVSPINMLLDLGEFVYANVLVIDEDGDPVEGSKMQIIPQDKTKIAIKSDSFTTNKSGYIQFSILGKEQGDTVVIVTDGVISTQINVAIKNLIRYALPYFYGDMQLSLVNPSEDFNYVKVQFHENSERLIPPVIIRLEGKEMKTLKLSEEMDIALRDGWAEVFSTEILFGGVWTNKGYLPFKMIEE
ncbi:MAG: hypothetical protein ACE5KZ_07485 [Candidatus Scalinduaceae bacterium]